MNKEEVSQQKKKLGRQLKDIRELRKISTYALEKAGIKFEQGKSIENGDKSYTIDLLIKYLNVIDIDINDLF